MTNQKTIIDLLNEAYSIISSNDTTAATKQKWLSTVQTVLHQQRLDDVKQSIRGKLNTTEVEYLKLVGVHLNENDQFVQPKKSVTEDNSVQIDLSLDEDLMYDVVGIYVHEHLHPECQCTYTDSLDKGDSVEQALFNAVVNQQIITVLVKTLYNPA